MIGGWLLVHFATKSLAGEKVLAKKDTLLVIPAYNEEQNLARVLSGLEAYRDRMDILVVDDGSADRTAEIAREHGLQTLALPFNIGIGGALETGYKYAFRQGYQFVARLDADGQHEPEDLLKVLVPVKEGRADFVSGSRFLGDNPSRMTSLDRRIGIRILAWLVNRFVQQKVTDPTSGFQAFNHKVLTCFMEEFPTDFPEVESILYLNRRRLRTMEVPARFHQRHKGKSSIDFWRSIYYMYKVTFALLILTVRDYPGGRQSEGEDS